MSPEQAGDLEVLHQAATWLEQGRGVKLATVLATWGSSPRPAGSLLAIRDDGRMSGSVSGGCVEDDLRDRLAAADTTSTVPVRLTYGGASAETGRVLLPCGGRLELLVESLVSAVPLRDLLSEVAAGELRARRVCSSTGAVSIEAGDGLPEFHYGNDALVKVFGAAWHLLLVGAGDIARQVTRIALLLGYRVTLCDPRADHRAGFDEPGVTVIASMPDDACRELADQPRAAVVTLAHDPRVDDMALMAALESRAFYVGALGSRRTSDARRRRLASLDLTPAQIARLHAPAGLPIGSRAPAEIALSIMAEITATRRLPRAQSCALRASEALP